MRLQDHLTVVPDWPRAGVNFLDLQSLLTRPDLFQSAVDRMASLIDSRYTSVVAVESRGFVVGSPLAVSHQLPLILARKPGKLPGRTLSVKYDTEYSQDELCVEADVDPGAHPLIIDDVLATGGTVSAVARLLRVNFACSSVSCLVLFNLAFLPGAQLLEQNAIHLLAVEDIDG